METGHDLDLATNDLGPLAWVLDELRKSLESASAALRRFVRDTQLARGTDMAGVDTAQLRLARQQLHQAVGALEMVGMAAPAHMLRAMESAVQKFVEKPELCSDQAAAKVERAGFALAEFLEAMLRGKPGTPVALFPQYRDVQELAGSDRVHPADLWTLEWRWVEPKTPAAKRSVVYDPAVRSKMDQSVLKVVKSGDPESARELADLSLALAATQSARQPTIFWKICAGYFEAVALGLLPLDIYVKRVGSRILLQYASLAKGELGVSDRLAQDLVFFCAQAVPPKGADAASLVAVREAWGLQKYKPVDYQSPQYGRFDPALLAQARKRVGGAKETWSALSGGDANKLRSVADQFGHVAETLHKLNPQTGALGQSLTALVEAVVRTGRPPNAEIAMEVATAILYLEAAFADLDSSEEQLAQRTAMLAQRLERVRAGGQPEPLETWMEELYRRVSDRQTMGSVVGELRGTLGELEKLLDQYFRNLADKAPLADAPGHLAQMRGVLSVLGLDQAANAVQRMRDTVEEIMVTEIDEERAKAAGTFDKLGNNLGALGFLIDMLNYQPALAKKLFVYDDATGELRPLMGRTAHPHEAEELADSSLAALAEEVEEVTSGLTPLESPEQLKDKLQAIAAHAVLEEQPAIAHSAREAAAAVAHDPASAPAVLTQLAASVKPAAAPVAPPAAEPAFEEDDLLFIFLEEAREVVGNGLAAVASLGTAPNDVSELTTLRRAFHTLKGSSRMVGLTEFGEAGWAMEQVLNTWLADQKPASTPMLQLARAALEAFGRWVEDIAAKNDAGWKSAFFRGPADAMRLENRLEPIGQPGAEPAQPAEAAVAELPAVEEPVALADGPIAIEELPPAIEEEVPAEVPAAFEEAAIAIGEEPVAVEDFAPGDETPVTIENIEVVDAAPAFDLAGEPAATEAGPEAAPEAVADLSAFEIAFDMPPAAAEPPHQPPEEQAPPEIAFEPFPQPADVEAAASFEATQVIRGVPPEPAEIPAHELAADFDFEPEAQAQAPAPAVEPQEIEGIDFASLSALAGSLPPPPSREAEPEGEPAPLHRAAIAAESEDQVKVIGTLRIGIPLYNVYLNEADEWSRRLATELAEWALELDKPVPESAIGIAHALSGSSATVGFHSLSEIARALESALEHTARLAWATPQHGKAFTDAAEEIRRLLHQFAAGFLKEPNPSVAVALEALKALEIPERAQAAERRAMEAAEEAEAAPVVQAEAPAPLAMQPAPAIAVPPPAAPARPAAAVDDEEDIDVADAIDPDLFAIFEEEAQELLPQMGTALRQWSARPENGSARDEVLRALHTLKGSARLAGALRLGELAHRMESHVEALGSENLSTADIDPVVHRFDGIQANFDGLRARAAAPAPQPVLEAEPVVAVPPAEAEPAARIETPAPAAPQRTLVAQAAAQLAVPRATSQAVRVRSQLLDRLMNQAGEVMITRTRLETELRQLRGALNDLTGNLDRLRSQLRDIELQADAQMQTRLAQAQEAGQAFDPLEFDRYTRVQELTRMMAESVNDVATVQRNIQRVVEATEDDLVAQARQTRELQRDLLRTRMVEFEGISDRLYRVVRLASKESGKQVKLDITGGSIEMDRGVLDRMTPAFEHLLRNCVAHGIEDPAVRAAAGKDPAGTIVVNLHQEGNDVAVEFRDDGAGLDLQRIRDKARQLGIVDANAQVGDDEAAQLIFTPGFSTASHVTELAGRGIGMDVVRSEVNALGGRIETSTAAGQGTTFKLVLPLTTAVTQVVMIRAGALTFGVPANLVEIVRRATAQEVEQAYESGSFDLAGEPLNFYWCGALLQASTRSTEAPGKTLPVVIFRSAAQRIAVHVDEILGNQEVVVKNLGPQLARLPGLAGMTLLASGAVVLIYNPVALATVYGEQARKLSAARAQPPEQQAMQPGLPQAIAAAAPQVPLVLVVDDSITVRRVTQRLLQREGYRVALAADGLQALERLAEEKPSVVLSDIEMPRMDGFDLARNIRSDDRLKDLPIIMITSRIAEKHREHAKELGVDHYLGKPYSEEELLSLVRHYSAQAVTA